MFKTSTFSFKRSLQSLWKLLYSYCQSVPEAGCPRSSAAFPGVWRSSLALHDACDQGRFKGELGAGTAAPSKNCVPCGPPMKFMIKHNLPLVRGYSLWQYRSVPPAAIMATPLSPPQNVNPRTATACDSLRRWPSHSITRGFMSGEFRVHWSLVR